MVEKYKTRDLSALNKSEKMLEVLEEKERVGVYLYKCDVDFVREHNLNMSRILRLKFHEWLNEKFTHEE